MKRPDDQHRRTQNPVAVIDIGSNSVRLVIFQQAKRNPIPFFNEKVLCGLGRSLATTGRLHENGVERALRALRRFRAICRQLDVSSIEVIATAAAREAENGPDFVSRAERAIGCDISVITGKREAHLAASGVICGFPNADGMVADLGGGSLEVIGLRKKKGPIDGVTLPLGGLRLIDISGGDLKKARKIVDAQLEKVDWLKKGKGRPFYAVGGTWRAFARLHMAYTQYPLEVMHAYKIPYKEAVRFAGVVSQLSADSLERMAVVAKARRETLPVGALVLERLLKAMRPSEFVASAFGVREGLLYSTLPEEEQSRDPLLDACYELATLRSRSAEHAVELCGWTDALFEGGGPNESSSERRLRHAACLLSDIGWRTHPDYRSTQSQSMIAQETFAGVNHPGRVFLALSVFFRNRGLVALEQTPKISELVDKETVKRARIVGAAVRTAHMISASAPHVIDKTQIFYDDDRLVLQIPAELADLEGERLDLRFGVLARELEREPEIRVGVREKETVTA
ncbi:MAG: exopolyphosphatase [Pseudomonadota bacterium]